jgi:hypothetical protein
MCCYPNHQNSQKGRMHFHRWSARPELGWATRFVSRVNGFRCLEKISLQMGMNYCGLAVPHLLRRRRGFLAIAGVAVLRRDCATLLAVKHVATSRTSSTMIAVAPQPVSATVSRAGDSPFHSGRRASSPNSLATALPFYKLRARSVAPCNRQAIAPTLISTRSP